jgi:hypothetical protein
MEDDDEPVSKKHWAGFLTRHPSLVTKISTRFDANCEERCNVANFEQMYHECCEKMVESKIAIKTAEENWLDKYGVVVEEEHLAFGRKTKYQMIQPNYLVFVDEVGDNTSQKDDGNIAGTKYIVGRKNRALMRAAQNDYHFTMLGFSLANGRPILCVIIVACIEIDAKIRMGLQPWCEVESEGAVIENLEANSHGTEKYFHFGPTCTIDGKK